MRRTRGDGHRLATSPLQWVGGGTGGELGWSVGFRLGDGECGGRGAVSGVGGSRGRGGEWGGGVGLGWGEGGWGGLAASSGWGLSGGGRACFAAPPGRAVWPCAGPRPHCRR